jgi:NAD(P)-dependent dehydrogenase (short-subunit alcohol dehydrogenase family)
VTGKAPAPRGAVVTGASRGIGRAIALALAAEGASFCLLGRDRPQLEASRAAALAAGAAEAVPVVADLADEAQLRSAVDVILGALPHLHVLVHCAGAYQRGPIASAAVSAFDDQYRANLRAPYLLTQLLLPRLRQAEADIVFVNSSQGLSARAGTGAFAATQHGLKALADSLREEVNPDGVRVLSVHLGRTATQRQERIFAVEGRRYAPERLLQPRDVADVVLAALRLPRTAELTSLSLRQAAKTY